MNGATVASATFLVVLAVSGPDSAHGAIGEAGGQSTQSVKQPRGTRVAQSGPVPAPIAPVTGQSDTAIALNIKPPLEGLRFIMFKDIPGDVTFSHGFRVKNSWMTSIRDLEKLQINPPPGFVGPLAFTVQFQGESMAGTAAQGLLIVDVEPPNATAEAKAVAGDPKPRSVAKAPPVSADEEREELARAATLMRHGDVATARLIYQNLATRASANGARALAETYDPAYLKDVVVAGLRPDIEAAKKWYKVAADLGDSKAATRLTALDRP